MRVSDFDYDLPDERIAKFPPEERGTTRLLVLNKETGAIEHRHYFDLPEFIEPGDVVVLNDTKVIKARLEAVNKTGQARELLLLESHAHKDDVHRHRVLYRGKLHENEILDVHDTPVTITKIFDGGIAEISSSENLTTLFEQFGSVPLPPYMKRNATPEDIKRYQTEFASKAGSVAAPTASLNFTNKLRAELEARGAHVVTLTLHVGLGTFLPIRSDEVEHHDMHSEYFEIPSATIATIQQAKQARRKIFAVGTTVTRTLEFAARHHPELFRHSELTEESFHTSKRSLDFARDDTGISGEANIFIYPGYKFQVVDALLTNFHAPKSTVLMMAAAFAGWDNLKHAYETAAEENYDFLSYGDSMLIK